jgi:cytochrome c2
MAKPEPGRDPKMVSRAQQLNLLFGVSSIVLLFTTALMIWDDYDREWRHHQIEFNKLEMAETRQLIATAEDGVDATRRGELEGQLTEGREEVRQRRDEVQAAEDALRSLGGEWYAADQDYRFTKARIDVARYEYDEAVHNNTSAQTSKKAHLDELTAEWNAHREHLEEVEGRRAAAQATLDELLELETESQKALEEMLGEKHRLELRLEEITPGFVSFVRNLPLLDLANPSLKVEQVMPANLLDDVIFTQTPKVDRCTTCHLGIDKRGYEDAPQPYTTHPNLELYLQGPHPIERVGCTVCHQGRGRATSFQGAAHSPSSKEQEEQWGKFTGSHEYHQLHHWDFPMLANGHTESQCLKCHKGELEVPEADRLNTGLMLIERYGCYGCHKIKGWEGLRKVGPDLRTIASKTNSEWIRRWIAEPQAFRPTRMPQIWNVRVDETTDQIARNEAEMSAVVAFVMSQSSEATFPAPPRGDLSRGRALFESVGCLGCHRVGTDERGVIANPEEDERSGGQIAAASYRTHGPNLAGTGSKLNAGWVYAWVQDPKSLWHETRMPRLRLTSSEAADITAYLMSLQNQEFVDAPRPDIDLAMRDQIVREYLLEQNTVAQTEETLSAMSEDEKQQFLGKRTVARYGCFGCHTIGGFEDANPIGTELTEQGSKLVERLDFGFEHETLPHTLPAWLKRKLMEPRIFDEDKEKRPVDWLRMGQFHFQPEEADAIVTAILSFSKEAIPEAARRQLSPDDQHTQEGLRLVRDFNCRGCHQVGAYGGAIKSVIVDQFERAGIAAFKADGMAPPMLYNHKAKIGEGARVHTVWLHEFLSDPSAKVRPWFEVRMPSFDFSEEQLNTLTRYFAAQDDVAYPYAPAPEIDADKVAAGRELFERWQCVSCHVVAGKLPNKDPSDMAPDLALVRQRLRPRWIEEWLKNPTRIQPGTRMPTNFPEDPEENAFPEILGGDRDEQVDAVTQYLLTFGEGGR